LEACNVIRQALAGGATIAAALLLGLALQVHRWQDTMRDDDLRFQVAPLADGLWAGPGGPGAGLAHRLLGVGDDVRFRTAEQLYVKVHMRRENYAEETQRLAEFGQAQSSLQHLADVDPSPARRARAGNLLGILLFEDATSAQDNAPLLLGESVKAFRDAIRDDAAEADAKYNLELLSTLLQPSENRRRDAPQDLGAGGLNGAGIASAGKGY
jgi:hypothetical protein